MKKKLYLILLFLAMQTQAQTIVAYDFNSGAMGWILSTNTSAAGGKIFMNGSSTLRTATSPTINLSGYSSVNVSADWNCLDSSSGFESNDKIYIQYLNGATWTTIWTKNGNEICPGSGNNQNGNSGTLDLPTGLASTRIRLVSDTDSNTEDINWDNVVLSVKTVDAVNDIQTIAVGSAGTISVLNNDTLHNLPVALANVNFTQIHTAHPNVSLNTTTGLINVAVGTPQSTYTITYQICDKANPTHCDTATATVTVSVPPGTPFSCPGSNDLYLSQGPDTNTGTQFQYIGRYNNPFNYFNVGGISHGITYNAIGYNQLDNFIYGINQSGNSSNELVRVDSSGDVLNLGSVTGLPVETYISGDMIGGELYVMQGGDVNRIYKINVATKIVTGTIILDRTISTSDIAYNSVTGLLYGVNSSSGTNRGKLFSINPASGAVTFIGNSNSTLYRYGAMYSDVFGNVYGNENGGGFYEFNITNGNRTLLSNSPASFVNDGAVCSNVTFKLGADLEVTKTSPTSLLVPGTTVTYTILATNNGPFGVADAIVTDNVPAGIPAANVSYTAVASAGSTTTVVGTQTGAINDVVDLPLDGTITYTVTIQVPATFTGNLLNTVTITSPNNSSDPNLSNNTSTYTHTQGACYENPATSTTAVPVKHGITILGRAGKMDSTNDWPMIRNSAYTALESKTKGFVITRIANPETAITDPKVGMMVFDTDADSGKGCLKINTDGTSAGWKCFNKPSCPIPTN